MNTIDNKEIVNVITKDSDLSDEMKSFILNALLLEQDLLEEGTKRFAKEYKNLIGRYVD
ncbi:hypothetical protein SDC9_07709 [bioreactor metagenome]|uniref:Uncharacterized protein n=1 Tax=bioreactor metagenome TaxID=1076179 RepID=A0A644T5J6_9ZZZZ|nr:hypothetical protein [Methanobrevibacter sp.]MEA4956574.1 hypothetical protein [Methanobrevibacter sp.]